MHSVSGVFSVDSLAFERLLDIRDERVMAREVDPVSVLAAYLKGIETVIDAVHRLEK